MRDSRIIASMAGVVAMGACAVLYVSTHGGLPPRIRSQPHEAIGQVMAKLALDFLQPGGQITVITRDTAAFKNPALDVQFASFRKTVRKAQATIASVHALQVDPLRPVEVPPGDFFELIRNTPKGSVIVSFMGPPLLTDVQRKHLREIKPAIVAFCSGSLPDRIDLRGLFQQGLLQAAVASRPSPLPPSAKSADRVGWFDSSFVVVTLTNLDALSPPAITPLQTRP